MSVGWISEYQAKALFVAHGVPAPAGRVARSVAEAVAAAQGLGTPVMVKSQVKIGGRGKAGGVNAAKAAEIAAAGKFPAEVVDHVQDVLVGLWDTFVGEDATWSR